MPQNSLATRKLRGLVLAAVSAVLVVAPAGPATAAPTPTPITTTRPAAAVPADVAVTDIKLTKVNVTRVRDMVHANKHLFVSTRDEVRVLEENGKTRKRLKNLPGTRGMLVSPKGDLVYVAVRDAGLIVAIDTRKLKVVNRFKVGQCPTAVALVGGRLFYARDECDALEASIESIDPRKGGAPVPSGIPQVGEPIFFFGGGNTLVTATPTSSSEIRSYRVSGTSATLQAAATEDSLVLDLAASPDGATVYVPNNPSGVRALPTSTLRNPTVYPTGDLPLSVAASRDGSQLAAVTDQSGPDLFSFRVGSTTPTLVGSTLTTRSRRPDVYTGTLTLSGDGKKVFQLRADTWDGPTYLGSAKTHRA